MITVQRNSAIVFIAYNLLNGARAQGIDNAAHLGGLIGGFVMGYLLSRPLTPDRDRRPWTRQWVATLGLGASATLLIVYLSSNGLLAPRQALDSDGNPIPLAGLAPAARSLGGFQLGMTPDEVQKLKGAPLTRENLVWLYNAIDNKHDAVISVHFLKSPEGVPGKIFLIDFTGHDIDSAPRDVPYLNSLTTEDVIKKYGGPLKKQILNNGWGELLFRNGIYIRTHNEKVFCYGVFDLSLLRT